MFQGFNELREVVELHEDGLIHIDSSRIEGNIEFLDS